MDMKFVPAAILTILKPQERLEIVFSYQKSTKKPFFPYDLPPGSLIIVLSLHVFSFIFSFLS